MRILGFSEKWEKLSNPTFTTFRFKRRDADWAIGEVVKVVYKPRRKGGGEVLGVAKILNKESRDLYRGGLTKNEIANDGFKDEYEMGKWLDKTYGRRWIDEPMNILLLRWMR